MKDENSCNEPIQGLNLQHQSAALFVVVELLFAYALHAVTVDEVAHHCPIRYKAPNMRSVPIGDFAFLRKNTVGSIHRPAIANTPLPTAQQEACTVKKHQPTLIHSELSTSCAGRILHEELYWRRRRLIRLPPRPS